MGIGLKIRVSNKKLACWNLCGEIIGCISFKIYEVKLEDHSKWALGTEDFALLGEQREEEGCGIPSFRANDVDIVRKEDTQESFSTGAVRASAIGKPQLSQLDNELLFQTAYVLEFGEKKYSRGNWRKGIPYNRCIDSLERHILAFKSGETNDPESGLHHLGHAACNLMFLLRYEADKQKHLDDRDCKPKENICTD